MTEDKFEEQVRLFLKTPVGRGVLLRAMRANPVPKEELKEIEAKLAKEHGKSITDILIECIQTGELSEPEIADAMGMLGGAMENNRFADELRKLQNDRKFKEKLFSLAPPGLKSKKPGDKLMLKFFKAAETLPPPRLSGGPN